LLCALLYRRPAIGRLLGCTIRCNDALSQHIRKLWTDSDILAAVNHAQKIALGSMPPPQLRIHLRVGPLQISNLLLETMLLRGLLVRKLLHLRAKGSFSGLDAVEQELDLSRRSDTKLTTRSSLRDRRLRGKLA
jgi:hypothetical protein